MADGRHIENLFWQSLSTILANLCKFRNGDEESHAGHLTKVAIFANSRWRRAAILKITKIWYADANFHSEDGYLRKIEIFQIQEGGRPPF